MVNITKKVLEHIGNNHTKVEEKTDFQGNYYSYITDTIYIAKKLKKKKISKANININEKAAVLVTVCHECIHSMQSKVLHILNTVCANLSIILTLVVIVLSIFYTTNGLLKVISAVIILTSIVVRLILEREAVNGSIRLSREIVNANKVQCVSAGDIDRGVMYIQNHKYLAYIQMIIDKLIFLVLVLVV